MFSDLKWMSFPERVIYMKAIQMFKTIRGGALNTLDRFLLLRLIYMQDRYVHRLISSCILQNLV